MNGVNDKHQIMKTRRILVVGLVSNLSSVASSFKTLAAKLEETAEAVESIKQTFEKMEIDKKRLDLQNNPRCPKEFGMNYNRKKHKR